MKTFAFILSLSAHPSGNERVSRIAHRTQIRIDVESLESMDKYDAIRELLSRSRAFAGLTNKEILANAVIERERLMSTAIGHGVAVAHGKTPAVSKTMIALGVSRRGVSYDSPDGKPVNFLFLVANPPEMHDEYLTVLSAIARAIGNKSLRASLLKKNCLQEKGIIAAQLQAISQLVRPHNARGKSAACFMQSTHYAAG